MRSKPLIIVLLFVIVVGLLVLLSERKEKGSLNVPQAISNAPVANVQVKREPQEKTKAMEKEGEVISIEGGNFEEFISSDVPVVVDFWQTGCGACMMLEPVYKEVAGEMKGKMKFAKFQIDKEGNEKIADKYDIKATPTMIVFKRGKELGRIIGYRDRESLEHALRNFLGK